MLGLHSEALRGTVLHLLEMQLGEYGQPSSSTLSKRKIEMKPAWYIT